MEVDKSSELLQDIGCAALVSENGTAALLEEVFRVIRSPRPTCS